MNELEKLKQIIEGSSSIVFFGGAGVSTESAIPDFRSNSGLYQNKNYPYPAEEILSHHFFTHHKDIFYDFYVHEMIYPNALPNLAHQALATLEARGKLKAIITQNIDGLHQMAGSQNVIELHGSIKRNHCLKCHTFYDEQVVIETKGICPKCNGYIKPDVILYEELLDDDTIEKAIYYLSSCDTLIVGGTSLRVYPAAGLIRYFKGKHLVLINKEKTPFDERAEIIIHDSIGKVLNEMIK